MRGALRLLLVSLVLSNLGFVWITDAASPAWLLPLAGLTVASPLLLRYRRRLLYRILWNGAVVAVFALLVHHATSGGVRYLLEDGLLLAALCQVHLLNNIGPDQKPDLLFFNSFLIAVVTSILSIDLLYLLLFALYAPLLVFAMQSHALVLAGHGRSPGLFRALARDGLLRSAAVLAATLLAFCFVPCDFHRRGLLGDRLRFRPGTLLSAGFSEEVELGRDGAHLGGGDQVVARVRVTAGRTGGVSPYWRGATLHRFDGREWRPARTDPRHGGDPWRVTAGGAWVRNDLAAGPAVEVELRDPTLTRIFTPLRACRLEVADPGIRARAQPMADHTFVLARAGRDGRTVRYRVLLSSDRPRPGGGRSYRPARRRDPLVSVERGAMPNRLRSLAREVADSLDPDASQHESVAAIAARLRDSYAYVAPDEEGAARSLVDFANHADGGHCEYFATALALMLRSRGIPCRLVTGFRSEEWDEAGTTLTIRARHAHAWVEVLDPRAGWYTVDATPPATVAADGGEGLFAGFRRSLGRLWDRITGFDREDRDRVLAWLAALPGRLTRSARDHPRAAGGVALLLGFLVAVRFRHRRRGPASVRGYVAAVRRSGLRLRSGETPRELLLRARASPLSPKRMARLERATRDHEAERYRP